MLKVTINFDNGESIVWQNMLDVWVYSQEDPNSKVFVSGMYKNKNAGNRIEYENCYRKPISIKCEPMNS